MDMNSQDQPARQQRRPFQKKPWAKGADTSTKPWQTKEWRTRRAQVIARTKVCEWCKVQFGPGIPAVVSHRRDTYTNPDGTVNWAAYMAMKDDEVDVLCKPCNMKWTRNRQRPDTPQATCPDCGRAKRPSYRVCSSCRFKDGHRTREEEIEDLIQQLIHSDYCDHGCSSVYISFEGFQGFTVECRAKEIRKRFPEFEIGAPDQER
jgi:hypothetical protein